MAKYVDSVGLSKAFELIKDYVDDHGGGGGGPSFSQIYPVGSIYMSVNSTDPGTLFGGEWQRLTDTFLLAAGSTYAADDGTHTTATGGAATHVHATKGHKLAANESGVPAHSHQILNSAIMYNNASSVTTRMATSGSGTKISANTNLGYSTYDNTAAAASKAHDHGNTEDGSSMPPYLPVYMWKRTA